MHETNGGLVWAYFLLVVGDVGSGLAKAGVLGRESTEQEYQYLYMGTVPRD